MSEDLELHFIGEETKAIFDKIQCSPITNYVRVVKIGRTMRCIESRIEDIKAPTNFITLLIISECLSQLRELERDLMPVLEGKQYEK